MTHRATAASRRSPVGSGVAGIPARTVVQRREAPLDNDIVSELVVAQVDGRPISGPGSANSSVGPRSAAGRRSKIWRRWPRASRRRRDRVHSWLA
jgi:hypothetical protein